MKSFHSTTLFTGTITSVNLANCTFYIELLTKEKIEIKTSVTTYYEVLRNIGDTDRNRVNEPDPNNVVKLIGTESAAPDKDIWAQQRNLIKYIQDKQGLLVCIFGIYSENDNIKSYSARKVVLMDSEPKEYGWEQTHWWVQQINTLFENWLDVLFQTRREFTESDFAEFYRTNLDLLGGSTLNSIQECATLSRFLYGLSSSYLLTGNERSLSAARACAQYIINAYANPTHDGKYMFWKFGRIKDAKSTKEIIPSQNPDDYGTYALYEQIYALSGLAQFYRITQDTWVLSYITRTISTFNRFFKDDKCNGIGYDPKTQTNHDSCYTGQGGYFSHLDPVTMRPDSDFLGQNKKRKNWNSIGDHIPAYLVYLIISLDPIPSTVDSDPWQELLALCQSMLKDCVKNILTYFPPTDGSLFVNERFDNNWTPDHDWGWQKDRGIIGHNLKISWNLTRSAHYFMRLANEMKDDENKSEEKDEYEKLANDCYQLSKTLGQNMKRCGVDLIRGGIFDALERHPKNGLDTEFAWEPTKDFWQQEQAILAYYIMQDVEEIDNKDEFLELARYCSAFWSLFFVDQDYRKIYFRTNEIGSKIIEGQYGIQAGHAVAGYHAFELCYLAHIYIKSYVNRGAGHHENFVLYFQPDSYNGITSLNVLPDFFRPEDLRLVGYKINGNETKLKDADRYKFQIPIANISDKSIIIVEYERLNKRGGSGPVTAGKTPPKNGGSDSIQIPYTR